MPLVSNPRVSVVIPSWNRRDDLLACIESLSNQEDVGLEIIVVDDAGTDDSNAVVRARYPLVHIIEGTFQCGPAYRRNQGILATKGEFILYVDSDIEYPDRGTVSRMVHAFELNPKLGAIGGEIALNTGMMDRAWGLMGGRMDYPERIFVNKGESSRLCDSLASLNLMTRRSIMREVQGFDPYYEWGSEDLDLCYKIREAGYQIVLQFECAAIHKAASTGRRKDSSLKYCMNAARFCLRHHGVTAYLLRLGWYTCRLGLGMVFRRPDSTEGGSKRLLKGYWWYFTHLLWALKTIRLPFLSEAEGARFERWKQDPRNKTL
jgi:GT2 family glycosyltransferase